MPENRLHPHDHPSPGDPSVLRRRGPALASFDSLVLLRWLDVVLLALAAPFAIALGLPAFGVLAAFVVWTAQRAVAIVLENQSRATEDMRRAVGLQAAGVIGRGWIVALTILAVGLAVDRADGAAAAATVLVAFTFHLAAQILLRVLQPKQPSP